MRKIAILAGSALLLFAVAACNNEGNSRQAASEKTAESFPSGTNIRYVDMDSITEHYNLAKDYKEWVLKKNESLEAQVKSLYAQAQKFEAECQKKAKSNGYLTEASYKADAEKYQNMVINAQKKEAEIRRQATEEDVQWTKRLQDSINSFVIDYNKEKKFDAILLKAAGVYFNPSLDITKDVIDGLNKRYNKVGTKTEAKTGEKAVADTTKTAVKK